MSFEFPFICVRSRNTEAKLSCCSSLAFRKGSPNTIPRIIRPFALRFAPDRAFKSSSHLLVNEYNRPQCKQNITLFALTERSPHFDEHLTLPAAIFNSDNGKITAVCGGTGCRIV